MIKDNHIFNKVPIIVLLAIIGLIWYSGSNAELVKNPNANTGDMAWMLTCTCLVFLMTPGLAFFYGGMVSKKNVISTLLQSFVALGIVSLVWIVVGFSLAFGASINGVIGNPLTYFAFNNVFSTQAWSLAPSISFLVFIFFQLKFAIITPAIVTGGFAERVKFKPYILFIILFTIFIYAPLAHWTWHPDGFLFKMGVLDFAGGTVVHMSAGIAALIGAWFIKQRLQIDAKPKPEPARISYVILGTGLLWFGWFGFNGGSAFGANEIAALAFATTNTASATAAVTWIFMETFFNRKPSALGFCVGAVVGLVAITPGAGFVSIQSAVVIGCIASIISFLTVKFFSKTGVDDTLDVFPCHGVGGIVGMILTGVFASKQVNPAGADGIIYGGTELFKSHLIAVAIVFTYVAVVTYLIMIIVNFLFPLRVTAEEEERGLDITQHGEVL